MHSVFDLANDYKLGIWGAVILSTAAEGRCRVLLADDMQSGFTWRGVTMIDPFSPSGKVKLDLLLDGHRYP